MFFSLRSTRTIILFYIIVKNHGDLILDKNLDFYKYFLIFYTIIIIDSNSTTLTFIIKFSILLVYKVYISN